MPRTVWLLVGLVILGCNRRAAAPPPSAPSTPQSDVTPADAESSAPAPSEAEERAPPSVRAADQTGWRALWIQLDERDEDIDLGEPPADDAEALEWMCEDGTGESSCEGPPPWAVKLQNDGVWIFHVVDVGSEGLAASEAFGFGSLARCAADTVARIEREGDAVFVVVEDYFEFPDFDCECDPEDDDDCQCYSSCGTPFEAECRMSITPGTVALGEPDAECDAYEVGSAAGYEL